MKGCLLFVLLLIVLPLGSQHVTAESQGLAWGVQTNQLVSYRIVTNLTDPFHNGIVENELVFAKVNETPTIPEVIEDRSQIPFATGTLYDVLGLQFTPYLAGLNYFPAMISDLTFILAIPAGNWTLIHLLYEAYGFYSLSQSETHYGISLGVIISNQRVQTQWLYFKENGTIARYSRAFVNSTHEASFTMTQTFSPEATSTSTENQTSSSTSTTPTGTTATGTQPGLWRDFTIASVATLIVAILVLIAVYVTKRSRR